MKKYEWILFDLDNTLLDFSQGEAYAFRQMLEQAGIPYQAAYFQIYQRINKKCWEDFEEGLITQEELRSLRFRKFFEAIGSKKSPRRANRNYLSLLGKSDHEIAGARELLNQLKEQAFQMAIVTNGLKEVQRPRLEKSKLNPYFHSIIISDEIGVAKPHKAYFDYAYEAIGKPRKDSILVIGDSINSDIQGANNYGLSSCWFNPNGKENTTEITPTYTIDKLELLHQIIWRKP